jgi:Tol biopolymer transport system component
MRVPCCLLSHTVRCRYRCDMRRTVGRFATVACLFGSVLASGSLDASATFPGSNGEIAYTRLSLTRGWEGASLRTIQPDGTAGATLWPAKDHIGDGFGQAVPWDVDWSPGGDVAAYVAAGTTLGNDRLLVGDPDTGDRTVMLRMTHFDSHAFIGSIAFAPDGTSLAFCAVDIGGRTVARLYTIGVDGSAPTLVADRPLCFADWSADGKLVAAAGRSWHRLVTLDPDGSNQTTILTLADAAFDGSSPSWSPDGSTIAFAAPAPDRKHPELFTVPATGGTPTRLTRTRRIDELYPVFSPDGNSILFTRTRDYSKEQADLFVTDTRGAIVTRLTDTPKFTELSRSWLAG